MNSKRYYSLTQVTEHLGFKMEQISSTHIYLTDGSSSFRLYPGETTFLYNDKAYSIKGELLKELNNEFYISEEYMLKIFNIFVREQDNELQLISVKIIGIHINKWKLRPKRINKVSKHHNRIKRLLVL